MMSAARSTVAAAVIVIGHGLVPVASMRFEAGGGGGRHGDQTGVAAGAGQGGTAGPIVTKS